MISFFISVTRHHNLWARFPDGKEYQVSPSPVFKTRPAVYTDGNNVYALFVDQNNNLKSTNLLSEFYEEVFIGVDVDGRARTVACSQDGHYFACTSTEKKDHLYILDNHRKELTEYSLSWPTYGTLLSIGTIEFDRLGQKIIFDALIEEEEGSGYTFWNIGFFNIKLGEVEVIIDDSLPEGIDVRNPTISNTSDLIIAFDIIHHTSGFTITYSFNRLYLGGQEIELRAEGLMAEGFIADGCGVDGLGGQPCFNADDSAIALVYKNNIYIIAINKDGDTFVGDYNNLVLVTEDSSHPKYFPIAPETTLPEEILEEILEENDSNDKDDSNNVCFIHYLR